MTQEAEKLWKVDDCRLVSPGGITWRSDLALKGAARAEAAFIVQACNAYDSTEALRSALEKIKGGSFPGATNLAIEGNWKGIVDQLQSIARAALSSSPAPSTGCLREWRPIETAPDLTWVLVTGRHHRDISPALVAQYHASSQWWESADDGAGIYMTPTHWMPLPPAPDAARTALAGVTAPSEVAK